MPFYNYSFQDALCSPDLDEKWVKLILYGVATAVDNLHKKNVAHCDIKPSNIMLDLMGAPHLIDYGCARIHSLSNKSPKVYKGTPMYSAPEYLEFKSEGFRGLRL